MPDVVVEIAFGSGYSTPAADRVWTDVSDYVEPSSQLAINFGRGDEMASADANTLSLTLDNSDGRFTALRPASPYYPNVRIGTPIRVTATPQGGTPSVRFLGFVEEWPVAWDGSDEYAEAQIAASSRLARLGIDTSLRSIVEETILTDSPDVYYTLGEAEGARRAADSSVNGVPPLKTTGDGAPVVFGSATGPATDGLTAAKFQGGQYLAATSDTMPQALYVSTVEAFARATSVPATDQMLVKTRNLRLILRTNGRMRVYCVGSTIDSPSSVADGSTHHFVVTDDNATASLYIDGVLVGSTGHLAISTAFPTDVWVGGYGIPSGTVGDPFAGTISHVAVWLDGAPVAADRIAAHYAAGSSGFAGETTTERLARYAALAGVPAAELATEAAATTVAHVATNDQTAIDMMRLVEVTEGGVLFDDRDGTLTMHSRAHRYNPSSTLDLDMAAQFVGADFAPKLDRTGLTNDVSAQNSAGTVTARVQDASSIDYYGFASGSFETMSDDDDEPLTGAAWRVSIYAEPKVRVPSLSVNLLDFTAAPSQDDVLAATVGTLVTVSNQPTQAATSTGSYFIEGCVETITGTSYDLTFNVSPAEAWTDGVVRFDDPARGFDSGARFAY